MLCPEARVRSPFVLKVSATKANVKKKGCFDIVVPKVPIVHFILKDR